MTDKKCVGGGGWSMAMGIFPLIMYLNSAIKITSLFWRFWWEHSVNKSQILVLVILFPRVTALIKQSLDLQLDTI